MNLTEKEAEVMRDLRAYCCSGEWARPMDVGGTDGSGHSAVLRALVRKGLVERRPRGFPWGGRGSYMYRPIETDSEVTA